MSSIILRMIMWGLLYILLLGACDISVTYYDGLEIHYKGWAGRLFKRRAITK